MEAKAIRCALVILFWTAAAALVLSLSSPVLKIVAVIAVAFAYTRLTLRHASLEHALGVGVAWLLFNVIAELTVGRVLGHGWYELIGSPANAVLRNLLMITWIAAPAVFARVRIDE